MSNLSTDQSASDQGIKSNNQRSRSSQQVELPRNGNNSGTPNPGSGNKNIINTENGLIEKKNLYYKNI